jgi:alginate O-acetyltransferase complex protein AlgI
MPLVDILLPLGISFFAFEFIHYLYDVYKGNRPIYGPVDFGLFAAFFPSQIAGPIKRYQFFLEQMSRPIRFNGAMFNEGVALLVQGLFKKVAIADNLIPLVNAGFANTATVGTFDAWIALLGFAVEVYCDFSGYTDMGRGSAMMLGYNLPINFDFPYLSASIQQFWRRWHITLSTWLRDYVYIPLGGGRAGTATKYRNLVITMTIGGLWHGAAWHYVILGFLMGVALVLNHYYDEFAKRTKWLEQLHSLPPTKVLCVVFTMLGVWLSFVLFRADNMTHAMEMYAAMFTWRPSSVVVELLPANPVLIAMLAYAVYALLYCLPNFHPHPLLEKLRSRLTPNVIPAQAVVYASVALAAVGFAPTSPSPFIYFQF